MLMLLELEITLVLLWVYLFEETKTFLALHPDGESRLKVKGPQERQ